MATSHAGEFAMPTSTLMQLAFLSDQAESLLSLQQYKNRADGELENARRELRVLLEKKNDLEGEIEMTRQRHLGQVVQEKYGNALNEVTRTGVTSADMVRMARIRELYNKHIAYRLIGRTIFHVKENEVGIRFETFYAGKFFECRYVFLRTDPSTNIECVWRHTMPPFIPMKQLETEFLTTNKTVFLDTIDDYLSAFIRRREQAKLVESMQYIQGLMSNLAFNYIQFTIKTHTLINVYLVYDNLKASLPTRVLILEKPEGDEFFDPANGIRLKTNESAFKMMSLEEATLSLYQSAILSSRE